MRLLSRSEHPCLKISRGTSRDGFSSKRVLDMLYSNDDHPAWGKQNTHHKQQKKEKTTVRFETDFSSKNKGKLTCNTQTAIWVPVTAMGLGFFWG